MTDDKPEKKGSQGDVGVRKRRRYLPPIIRYLIIALWGVVLSALTFYLLRKIGY